MVWKEYQTIHQGLGTLCEVYIDASQEYIKRCFYEGAKTVSGRPTRFTKKEIGDFFENEIYWLKKLDGEWLPELVEINKSEKYVIQKYYNANLLDHKKQIYEILPDIEEQIIDMYKFFRINNVYKRNGSLSNLTYNDNKLIAFDFKWSTLRPSGVEKEIYSYDNYLNKINPDLVPKLKSLL